ncbi:MAG: MFS transporter [Candidatus Lokiarchaeota archaeon]|nr:MFS transporter [Candidatus Lokiarchaeota archaeon]
MTESVEKEVYDNSLGVRVSYGTRELFGQWVSSAFSFTVFFFYEVVIGLPVVLAMTVFIIYSIWNAFNDPIMGYIMERVHMPWEKKRGVRRFPWMVIGAVTWLGSYLLIYLVPSGWYGSPAIVATNQWLIAGWYLGTLCIYDFLLAIWDINVLSLFPDKFRGLNERRSAQGFGTIFGIIGLVLSALIPPMFITTGVAPTYITSALVTVGFGLVFFIMAIPGVKESQHVLDYYKERKERGLDTKVESFFKSAKTALSNKLFVVKALFFFGYQVSAVMIQTSAFYIVTFLLDEGAFTISLLLGAMLLGSLISVPLWTLFSKKVNDNRKLGIIAGAILFITFIPLIFAEGLIMWMIFLVFFGVGVGGHWFIDVPLLTDVLDDIAAKTKKRQQSIYYGYQAFFARFSGTFIAITISVTHLLTGFIEGATTLAELTTLSPDIGLALFGIRIHSSIVPAIFALLLLIVFWKFYDLTPDKVASNKAKLKELGI